ncbi:MAG TPA: DUF983 domain-containing protein [Acetobacteraceae bacterium]|nr:DUF983 domain-containing protein [Acetobacteraceae bacterium]
MAPTRWQPNRLPLASPVALPSLGTAVRRGLLCRCPACGEAHLFNGYLRVVPECRHCAAPLGLARADDAPPYFTIFLVGHIIIPVMFLVERHADPSVWLEAAIFLPLTLALTLALLRPIKGGTVGLMLTLGLVEASADD